jgi:hypothetical protein
LYESNTQDGTQRRREGPTDGHWRPAETDIKTRYISSALLYMDFQWNTGREVNWGQGVH